MPTPDVDRCLSAAVGPVSRPTLRVRNGENDGVRLANVEEDEVRERRREHRPSDGEQQGPAVLDRQQTVLGELNRITLNPVEERVQRLVEANSRVWAPHLPDCASPLQGGFRMDQKRDHRCSSPDGAKNSSRVSSFTSPRSI